MNNPFSYVNEIRTFLESFNKVLTNDEKKEVEYLINHDECPEAIRALAWIIAKNNKPVTKYQVEGILRYTAGWFEIHDLPENLMQYATDI